MTVKRIAYALAILLTAHLVFDVYFYIFKFKDTQLVISEFEKENQNLIRSLNSLRDSLKKLSKIQAMTQETTVSVAEEFGFDTTSIFVQSTGDIEIPFDKLFNQDEDCTLSDNGQKVLTSIWNNFKDLEFKELLILAAVGKDKSETDRRVKCVLNVKQFFIELGAPQDKVWAWVRNDVKEGAVVIRLNR